jgi:hypothetical protein
LPGGHGDRILFDEIRMRRLLERDLIGGDAEVAIQRLLGRFHRRLDELLEFDVGEVGAGFPADEVGILAVAIAAVAK